MRELTPTHANLKRRWFRFSLRTLLVLAIVLGVCVGWIAGTYTRLVHARKSFHTIDMALETASGLNPLRNCLCSGD